MDYTNMTISPAIKTVTASDIEAIKGGALLLLLFHHLFYDTVDPHIGPYTLAYAHSDDGLQWVRPGLGSLCLPGAGNRNLLDIRRENHLQ